jgi:hypothetical protein
MNNFWAAVKDLLEFAFAFFGSSRTSSEFVLMEDIKALPTPKVVPFLTEGSSQTGVESMEALVSATHQTLFVGTKEALDGGFINVSEARVWVRPLLTFDGESSHLAYGTPVEVLGYEGRFAQIRGGSHTGWILKDEITQNKSDLYPIFNTGEIYSANHPETKKLRALLKDEFSARDLYLPLQDVEFVSYQLFCRSQKINWSDRRPRLAGSWQNILKGAPHLLMGIAPKANSIIEFVKEDGVGFVGFVEEVSKDDSLTLVGFGRLIEGEYRKEIVEKLKWQEWRPVFIQLT